MGATRQNWATVLNAIPLKFKSNQKSVSGWLQTWQQQKTSPVFYAAPFSKEKELEATIYMSSSKLDHRRLDKYCLVFLHVSVCWNIPMVWSQFDINKMKTCIQSLNPTYTSWVPQPTIVLLFTMSIPWWPQLTPRLLDWLAALWSEKQICLRVSIKKKHGRSEVKIYLLSQIFFNLFWRKKRWTGPLNMNRLFSTVLEGSFKFPSDVTRKRGTGVEPGRRWRFFAVGEIPAALSAWF